MAAALVTGARPALCTGRQSAARVYLWGGVGRGKTWLMDVFYQALPGERKLRQHFHRFMYDLHHELTLKKAKKTHCTKLPKA